MNLVVLSPPLHQVLAQSLHCNKGKPSYDREAELAACIDDTNVCFRHLTFWYLRGLSRPTNANLYFNDPVQSYRKRWRFFIGVEFGIW
jgi:hypothetical protein